MQLFIFIILATTLFSYKETHNKGVETKPDSDSISRMVGATIEKKMKKLLLLPVLFVFLTSWITSGCNGIATIEEVPSDSIDVYARLKPNDEYYSSRYTYGKDSVLGHTIKYSMATDSSNVYTTFDITLLEQHPKITANLLSFIHSVMLNRGFINEGDTIVPFSIKEMTDKGLSQLDILKKALDWESDLYYKEILSIMDYIDMGYILNIVIYPVFLNEDYVTYMKYSDWYTGGMHGDYSSYLQTYNLKTGESVDLDDMIIPEKSDILRECVVRHMASKYPMSSSVTSVEAYIDSLNRWKGLADIGVFMGTTKDEDRERITLKNYPLNDPGIHGAGLVFTYEKYHLTPGIYGCPTILVPFSEIRSCLKKPFCNYYAEETEFEKYKDADIIRYYSDERLDSIRTAWGPAADGNPWPRDITDWYRYRHGNIRHHYKLNDIIGTWIGYGDLYDSRQILTINADGTFSSVTEEAFSHDEDGKISYVYAGTVKGKYLYNLNFNTIMFKNWDKMELNDETLEAYVKQRDPDNKYLVVHSIKQDTIYMADDIGDIWPFIRNK